MSDEMVDRVARAAFISLDGDPSEWATYRDSWLSTGTAVLEEIARTHDLEERLS